MLSAGQSFPLSRYCTVLCVMGLGNVRWRSNTFATKLLACWTIVPSFGVALRVKPHLQGLDVAIIGGGVAGLASAVALRTLAGVKATVFEADQGFGHGGFGLALWPNGLRALHHIDTALHDEVVRAGSVIEERMFTTSEATNIDYCREREAFGHPMLCVRSLSLHNSLRRAALRHGCEIVSGVACKSISPVTGQEDDNKRAMLVLTPQEGGENEVVTADFVVGADGLKSVVRRHIGDPALPRDTECVWLFGIVGHAACPILLRNRMHTFFLSEPGKAASLMPVGDHTYWAVALTGEDRQEAMDLSGGHREMQTFLKRKFGEECPALIELIDATPPHQIQRRSIEVSFVSSYGHRSAGVIYSGGGVAIDHHQRLMREKERTMFSLAFIPHAEDRPATHSFVSGARTGEFYSALVGDAAHPTRPSLGQGANMALEDAVQLALLMRETDSIEELLTEYDAARVLRCATLQGDSEFVARRRERQEGVDWRRWGEDGEENRIRPANKGMGNAEFVYNWEPARLRHFPWKSETPSRNNGGST